MPARAGMNADEWASLTEAWMEADVGLGRLEKDGGVEHVVKHLEVDTAAGLTDEQVEERREQYGSNKIPEKRARTFLEHLVEAFQDETLLILVAAAALALGNALFISDDDGDMIEALSILAAVVIVSGVASTLNFVQDLEFRALRQLEKETVFVTRNGVQTRVPRTSLVVGDCFEVRSGAKVPADALLLPSSSADGVSVDESSATGESEPRLKTASDCLLLSGTRVVEGAGRGVVVCVGERSSYGRHLAKSQGGEDDDGPTPLQGRLDGLAKLIGWFGLVAAVMTAGALAIIAVAGEPGRLWQTSFWLGDMVQFAVVGVTIVVVAVPEGLPLAVTISLAFSSSAMVADKILVRKLQACETMGSATVICSDKTGTLTENKMTVVAGRLASASFLHRGEPASSMGPAARAGAAADLVAALTSRTVDDVGRAVILNCNAEMGRDSSSDQGAGSMVWLGNPSECAMLSFLDEALDQRASSVRSAAAGAGGGLATAAAGASAAGTGIIHRRHFSSKTKSMATAVVLPSAAGAGTWLFVKGAFETILDLCDREMQPDGTSAPLDAPAVLAQFEPAVHASLRTIAVARLRVDGPTPGSADAWAALEAAGGMELVGVVGIRDPLRAEVPAAVATCQRAQIRVIMVTGDHVGTATAIARGCGILPPTDDPRSPPEEGTVMQGRDLAAIKDDPDALRAAVSRLRVLARSSPDDKHTLVDTLRKAGEIVAATGDGTNDGPALKHANVGLAMGITGTDVAKDASDIVILDDNFTSIRKAVVWGRCVYDNIRRFLQFQLTINVVALVLSFATACSLGSGSAGSADAGAMQERLARQLPLNSQQMLFCNLLMDSLAALALATEPPSDAVLDRAPERKSSPLITPTMWKHIVGHAALQLTVLLLLFLHPTAYAWLSVDVFRSAEHRTVIFNVFILMNVINLPFARKVRDEINVLEGIHKATLFVLILLGVLATQVVLVQTGGAYFGTAPLNAEQWGRCLLLASLTIPVGILLRLVPTPGAAAAAPSPAAGKLKDE